MVEADILDPNNDENTVDNVARADTFIVDTRIDDPVMVENNVEFV